MSKKDGQRHLRRLFCDGCPRRCRYADFHILPGKRGKAVYDAAFEMLLDGEDGEEADRSKWTYKKRGRVLGSLHEMKMAAWLRHTTKCREGGHRWPIAGRRPSSCSRRGRTRSSARVL